MLDDAPASLRPLVDLLNEIGFELVSDEQGPFVFGDRRIRWERHDLRIQVSLDRGRWFIDVSPTSRDDWTGYGLEILVDTLDDVDRFTHLLTLRDSTEIIRNRLPEIAKQLSTLEGCDEVDAKHHERALRWFGA